MNEPRSRRGLWYIIGAAVIAAFVAYGATSFRSNLTPYVSFDEATRMGSHVQVAGSLAPGSVEYLEEIEKLRFVLRDDEGGILPVVYGGVKPGNFEEATQIVAIGKWSGEAFEAEHLLVKCPSKYQGVDQDPSTHGQTT